MNFFLRFSILIKVSLALCADMWGRTFNNIFSMLLHAHHHPPPLPSHSHQHFSLRERDRTSCVLSYQIVIFLVFIIFKHMPWENIIIMYRRHSNTRRRAPSVCADVRASSKLGTGDIVFQLGCVLCVHTFAI